MNTYKNTIITTFSIAMVTLLVLILPSLISIAMFIISAVVITSVTVAQTYDINYKYWFSFAGQLCALIFVSVSFVAGLSFIANGMV